MKHRVHLSLATACVLGLAQSAGWAQAPGEAPAQMSPSQAFSAALGQDQDPADSSLDAITRGMRVGGGGGGGGGRSSGGGGGHSGGSGHSMSSGGQGHSMSSGGSGYGGSGHQAGGSSGQGAGQSGAMSNQRQGGSGQTQSSGGAQRQQTQGSGSGGQQMQGQSGSSGKMQTQGGSSGQKQGQSGGSTGGGSGSGGSGSGGQMLQGQSSGGNNQRGSSQTGWGSGFTPAAPFPTAPLPAVPPPVAHVPPPPDLQIGFAYEVYRVTGGRNERVDPARFVFRTGDQFHLRFMTNMPGIAEAYNISPEGVETRLGSWTVPAAQQVTLPANGYFRFQGNPGQELFRLRVIPCAVDAASRDRVLAVAGPVAADLLPDCAAVTRVATTTRSIGLVENTGGTNYGVVPVDQAEVQAGAFSPRQVTIRMTHRY